MKDPAGEEGTSSCCCHSPKSGSHLGAGSEHAAPPPASAAPPPEPAPVPECPVCFSAYDRAFRTPLRLPRCAHTFCLACVTRLSLTPPPAPCSAPQDIQCPLCRTPIPLPPGGAPCLPPNLELLSHLSHDGAPKRVWLEGPVLCYWTGTEGGGAMADGVVRLPLSGAPAAGVGLMAGARAGPGAGGEGRPVAMVTVLTRRRLGGLCGNFTGPATIGFLLFVVVFVAIFLPVYFLGRGVKERPSNPDDSNGLAG